MLGCFFGKEGQGSQGEEDEERVKGQRKLWQERAASGSQQLSVNIGSNVDGVCSPSHTGTELVIDEGVCSSSALSK